MKKDERQEMHQMNIKELQDKVQELETRKQRMVGNIKRFKYPSKPDPSWKQGNLHELKKTLARYKNELHMRMIS